MSSGNRTPDHTADIEAVQAALRRLTSEIDGLDARASDYFGVHRTDQHCLDLLASRGPLPPSELARAMSLTSGGMSIALGRLERAGLVRRLRNPDDRRSVLVEATDLTRRRGREFFGPLNAIERQLLARYSPRELRAIHTFLDQLASALAEHHGPTPPPQPPSPAGPRSGGRSRPPAVTPRRTGGSLARDL
jgi:DNA-binding MarR family transcriptional regulator